MIEPCPLCLAQNGDHFHTGGPEFQYREFFRCPDCRLVWVPQEQHVSPTEEKRQYSLHTNDRGDAGYVNHLRRLVDPLLERVQPGSKGLDFGSGPSPVLAELLTEAGHEMRVYDPFFAADPEALDDTYDFITATETFEHLTAPRPEIERLDGCLRPGGLLGVMTSLRTDEVVFRRWHYPREETHIRFYAPQSMEWIAKWRGWLLESPAPNVVFFGKGM